MNLNIKYSNLESTEAIKNYIENKIAMLEKYLNEFSPVKIDFEVELTTKHHQKGDIFRAEMNLFLPGDMIRIEKTESDLYKAIDKVKDHAQELIIKHKEKNISLKRK
ncbi:MAG: ribosome-associated translation inhibitor RaiA [Patescibacteria group bacterium]|nr:ribosome-associated translation inhibitor RaiA [Patescibacteria group bacterium]